MPNIPKANNKLTIVFILKGSLNNHQLNQVNTIAPILNPSKREGHSCPLYAETIYLTDPINNIEIGIPISTTNQ